MNLLFVLFYIPKIKNYNKLYFETGTSSEIIRINNENNKTINYEKSKNKFNDCALIPIDEMPKNNFFEDMKKK